MFESYKPFRSRNVASWEAVKLDVGDKFRGFKAGPVIGVPTHYFDGTKGCRKALTKGGLACACETMQIETRWRGYLPMWDKAGVRWYVVLGQRYGEQAMELPHMAQVLVTRTEERGNPVSAVEHLWTVEKPKLKKTDELPQDIRRWMMIAWGDHALNAWIEEHGLADIPADKPVAYTRSQPEVDAKLLKTVKERIVVANPHDAKLPATFEEAMNGIHKRKKGSR